MRVDERSLGVPGVEALINLYLIIKIYLYFSFFHISSASGDNYDPTRLTNLNPTRTLWIGVDIYEFGS